MKKDTIEKENTSEMQNKKKIIKMRYQENPNAKMNINERNIRKILNQTENMKKQICIKYPMEKRI